MNLKNKFRWDGYVNSLTNLYSQVLIDNKFFSYGDGYRYGKDTTNVYIKFSVVEDEFKLRVFYYHANSEKYIEYSDFRVYTEKSQEYKNSQHLYMEYRGKKINPKIEDFNKHLNKAINEGLELSYG